MVFILRPSGFEELKIQPFASIPVWDGFSARVWGGGFVISWNKQHVVSILVPAGPEELKIKTVCLDSCLGWFFCTGLGQRVGKILEGSGWFLF